MKLLLRLEQHKVEPKTKPIRIKMRISGVDICLAWQEILNIFKDEERNIILTSKLFGEMIKRIDKFKYTNPSYLLGQAVNRIAKTFGIKFSVKLNGIIKKHYWELFLWKCVPIKIHKKFYLMILKAIKDKREVIHLRKNPKLWEVR